MEVNIEVHEWLDLMADSHYRLINDYMETFQLQLLISWNWNEMIKITNNKIKYLISAPHVLSVNSCFKM